MKMVKNSDSGFLEAALPATDRVYNLARRCSRSKQEAEDLVQETYLRALTAWRARRRPEKVDAWLATICLNVVRSQYRWRSRRPDEKLAADPAAGEASGEDTAARALDRLQTAALRRAISALPEEQRIAVTLVDIVGFTAAEAARITGSPRGTVLSRVHRARKALARAMSTEKVNDLEP